MFWIWPSRHPPYVSGRVLRQARWRGLRAAHVQAVLVTLRRLSSSIMALATHRNRGRMAAPSAAHARSCAVASPWRHADRNPDPGRDGPDPRVEQLSADRGWAGRLRPVFVQLVGRFPCLPHPSSRRGRRCLHRSRALAVVTLAVACKRAAALPSRGCFGSAASGAVIGRAAGEDPPGRYTYPPIGSSSWWSGRRRSGPALAARAMDGVGRALGSGCATARVPDALLEDSVTCSSCGADDPGTRVATTTGHALAEGRTRGTAHYDAPKTIRPGPPTTPGRLAAGARGRSLAHTARP